MDSGRSWVNGQGMGEVHGSMSEPDDWGPDEYTDGEGEATGKRPALRIAAAAPDWHAGLTVGKGDRVQETVGNAAIILQRSTDWDSLKYDEFRGEPTLGRAPVVPGLDPPRPGPLDDYSVAYLAQWLALRWRMKIGPVTAGLAAMVASKGKGRAVHPVREYLRGVEWDGVPRVDRWLSEYAGAAENLYTAAVGRMWMIAAVARVMQRISICKTMLILEGAQDAGKSTLLRRLCPVPEWFSDTPVDLGGGKDQYQSLRGKWIVEIPELDGFRGKDATRIKSFVSSPVDNYRKSYGKTNEDVPRQCVFAGTTNEEHYLHDSTGNVRFWPVRMGAIDFVAVERDRDQLWAEAMVYYLDGAEWHISDMTLVGLAKAEAAEREEEDAWSSAVAQWIGSPLGRANALRSVSTSDVLEYAIELRPKDHDKSAQTRIGILMKKFGFKHIVGTYKPRMYRIEGEA